VSETVTDAAPLIATPSQTVGPFFHFALTAPDTCVPALQPMPHGERIALVVRVSDGQEVPVTDAMVEIWQAGADEATVGGTRADVPYGFARLPTGEDGACTFETVRPRTGGDAAGGTHAAHVNVCLFARGLLRQLHTRVYFAGDARLDTDPVLALVPEDRRATLLATPDPAQPDRWRFELRLQGQDETVFFDL
jgi:protocatechuate 3,4-dioxygenase alpha subunit